MSPAESPAESPAQLLPVTRRADTPNRRELLFASAASLFFAASSSSSPRQQENLSAELVERYWAAVAAGETDAVAQLLRDFPALLQVRDVQGRSAYAVSLLRRHREVAELLAARGYESDLHEAALALDWDRYEALAEKRRDLVNALHPLGGTAMHAAAWGGAGSEIWRVYATAGDPNPDATTITPLQAALEHPDLATAELTAANLLANSASPRAASTRSPASPPPPLHLAAARGSLEIVEMLVRHGAQPTQRDAAGRTAAQAADRAGHESVGELLRRPELIARTHNAGRAAATASGEGYKAPDLAHLDAMSRYRTVGHSHGNFDGVREALANTPLLAHSIATTGERAVEAGAHMGRRDIVELLLEHGAPYALSTAVMRGDRARVMEMLSTDPQRIHERGAHDFALLWYPLIGRCEPSMTELLLAHGADVEEQHFLGTTALHWASMRGDLQVVELLLAAGADIDRPGRKFAAEPERPIDLARKREQRQVVDLLLARGARS